MGPYETLLYDERDYVATVTLNRPDVHNAFNKQMQAELYDVWRGLRRNDDVRAIVLTGTGDEAFCTGIDRGEAVDSYLADPDGDRQIGRVSTPFMYDSPSRFICPKMCDLWKPVVAAVNGMACGGALYMLGEVDIIIAAEHATFFDPHVSYGMVSGYESVFILQKLPLGETLRLALMGANERMSAQRAHQVGLVSEVVPMADLLTRAEWIASRIAASAPLAIQATLRSVWMGHDQTRKEALELVNAFVSLGSNYDNIAAGQRMFRKEDKPPDFEVR
jgi:enoyl-CoA hydratase/carnithine racemase